MSTTLRDQHQILETCRSDLARLCYRPGERLTVEEVEAIASRMTVALDQMSDLLYLKLKCSDCGAPIPQGKGRCQSCVEKFNQALVANRKAARPKCSVCQKPLAVEDLPGPLCADCGVAEDTRIQAVREDERWEERLRVEAEGQANDAAISNEPRSKDPDCRHCQSFVQSPIPNYGRCGNGAHLLHASANTCGYFNPRP